MSSREAFAKINLALVVGPLRGDGKHEVGTVLQRIDLHDDITLDAANALVVEGFPDDTLVRDILVALAGTAGVEPLWRVRIGKRVPVAAGLGGGSSDAATALSLANATLEQPLSVAELHQLAASIGSDVPFFLRTGPQLAIGDGSELTPVELPAEYAVFLVVPGDVEKESTPAVYDAFDARGGAVGFAQRAESLRQALDLVSSPRDLASLPPNDLVSSPLTRELEALGAFRADVSGAGPTVYGLFEDEEGATGAAKRLAWAGRTYVTRPVGAADLP